MDNVNYRHIVFWFAMAVLVYYIISYYSNATIVSDVNQSGGGNPGKLYLFYATWCGHCTKFRLGNAGSDESAYPLGSPPDGSEWGKTFYYYNRENPDLNVEAIELNCDNGHPLMERYGVKGFPTMVLSTDKGSSIYDGSRTSNDIQDFVAGKMSG